MGKTHGVSQDLGGFCLNPRNRPAFFENCTRFLASRTPLLLSCMFFNCFGRVKQGALDIARTGTGKFLSWLLRDSFSNSSENPRVLS